MTLIILPFFLLFFLTGVEMIDEYSWGYEKNIPLVVLGCIIAFWSKIACAGCIACDLRFLWRLIT